MKLAFLYAGQGTQHVGMGADLYEKYPRFADIWDAAAPGFDLKDVCLNGPAEQLNQTRYTQPCMVAFAAGVTAELQARGIRPDYACGLSLGEYSALQAAGVWDAATAIDLVAFRGRAMEQAVQGMECGMTAVLGLERPALQEACEKAGALGVVEIANYNCPGQLVIAGEKAAVDEAGRLAKEAGARRCMPLKVSGPFHTSLMKPAGDALRERFKSVSFGGMDFPVVFNCLGTPKAEEESIAALLEKQVQSSVYLEDSLRWLQSAGVDTMVEIGPGRALSGFVRKTCPGVKSYAIESAEELEAFVQEWKGENA